MSSVGFSPPTAITEALRHCFGVAQVMFRWIEAERRTAQPIAETERWLALAFS